MGMFTEPPEPEHLGCDRYGRLLPIPQWKETPDDSGYWFYAANRADWDLARPVPVTKITDSTGTWFEVKLVGRVVENVRDVKGVWYGPIRVAAFSLPAEAPKC